MVYRITPSLGPDIEQKGPHYFDAGQPGESYQLGSVVRGSDGGEYFYARATGTIAATADTGTQVAVTFPAWTVETGSGGFYTRPGVAYAAGDLVHVRRGAANATPT